MYRGFNASKLLITLLLVISFVSIITLVYIRKNENQLPVSASETVNAIRGVEGDYWADIVLGKDSFSEDTPGEVVSYKVMNPGGTIVDRTVRPNRIYVYDGSNSRVLGYRALGSCSQDTTRACTADSDCQDASSPTATCTMQFARPADLALGQPDLFHSACNGDSNFQLYPQRASASAATLCSMPESQISTTEGGSHASMAVNSQGDVYIPDFDNHRVLLYRRPFETDTIADAVWGQSDFIGNACNRGRGLQVPSEDSLCYRSPSNQGFVGGVDIDATNNLWVTDNQNHRVLRFPYDSVTGLPAKVADIVLGQQDFTSHAYGTGMNQMFAPAAVRMSPSGSLYVADSLNYRVIVFDPPFTSGMNATRTFAGNFKLPTGD